MKIDYIYCPPNIKNKIVSKHNVSPGEGQEVLLNMPRIRFAEKGYTHGENVYAAFGQTYSGRYLSVFFIYKSENNTAVIISARDMTRK